MLASGRFELWRALAQVRHGGKIVLVKLRQLLPVARRLDELTQAGAETFGGEILGQKRPIRSRQDQNLVPLCWRKETAS